MPRRLPLPAAPSSWLHPWAHADRPPRLNRSSAHDAAALGVGGLDEDDVARRLAQALVDFDVLLALDVVEPVMARADSWDDPNASVQTAGRKHLAGRYRLLMRLIEARLPVQVGPDS
jgi:hypothetical protein